jgi:tetratricopeptide (TPR) repeat protein
MRSPKLAVPLLALAAGLAAPAPARAQAAPPAMVTRLEQQRDRNPAAVPTLRALGIAYYKAGRWADARTTLQRARELAPKDGVVALYLGMAAEQQGDLATARTAYTSYLSVGRTSRARGELRKRLAALTQQEVRAAAKQALVAEQQLGAQPGNARTVAVLPLRFSGADSTLVPLERGVAELLVTDLSRSPQLTIVERERMQALIDEMALSRQQAGDPSTTLRAGRLMRAGRVVSGQITQLPSRRLSINSAVVDVPTTRAVGTAQGDDQLDALFALEKRIAFQLFDALGVTLTPAQRAAVEERPTRSLAAFLAYSNGLAAEDRGDLAQASRHYAEAVRIDPAFRLAQDRQQRADAAREGQAVTPQTLEATLAGTLEGGIADAAGRGIAINDFNPLGGTMIGMINDLNPSIAVQMQGGVATATPPSNRDPASSAAGTDGASGPNTGRLVIIIRQPTTGTPAAARRP